MNEPQRHPTISKGTDISSVYKVVQPLRFTSTNQSGGGSKATEQRAILTFLVATEFVFEGTLK